MTFIIKNFDDFNFDNIIYGNKIVTNDDNGKYYMYYVSNETNDIPKEIHIQIPETRLIYNLANHKYKQINIPLYPDWNKINIFINFIEKLETHIKNTLLKKKKKYDFSNLINIKNNINNIKTNITEEFDKILTNLKINQEIIIIIKISYIWYKKYDNIPRYGLSSEIVDIKYTESLKKLEKPIEKPIEKLVISQKQPNEINSEPPVSGIRLIPSINDLQNALKLLKKIDK